MTLTGLNWSGWELEPSDGSWHNILYPGGMGDVTGWHGRAIVVPTDIPERFDLHLDTRYLTSHVHGLPVDEQPHSIHETFDFQVTCPDLAYAQRFSCTWVLATIEVFDEARASGLMLVERNADELRAQVHRVIDDALGGDEHDA